MKNKSPSKASFAASFLTLTFTAALAWPQVAKAVTMPFPTDAPPTQEEVAMSPLIDLENGGQATGAAQGSGPTAGGLQNGSLLPEQGDGFKRSSGPNTSWGTGMMISLIMNSAQIYHQQYPEITIRTGDIAQEHGGSYQPHKSHQSGLDADILYMGATSWGSVLDGEGHVTERFNPEKNWAYWRLLTSQQIMKNGHAISAVSMILVDPRLKTFLCEWAKANNLMQNPLDLEILKRLRPTEGHDDHFHLRLKCSSHYANCIDSRDGFTSTGCDDPAPTLMVDDGATDEPAD